MSLRATPETDGLYGEGWNEQGTCRGPDVEAGHREVAILEQLFLGVVVELAGPWHLLVEPMHDVGRFVCLREKGGARGVREVGANVVCTVRPRTLDPILSSIVKELEVIHGPELRAKRRACASFCQCRGLTYGVPVCHDQAVEPPDPLQEPIQCAVVAASMRAVDQVVCDQRRASQGEHRSPAMGGWGRDHATTQKHPMWRNGCGVQFGAAGEPIEIRRCSHEHMTAPTLASTAP